MKKTTRKSLQPKKTVSSIKNKKMVKRAAAPKVKAPDMKQMPEKKIEKASLLNANQIRTSLENIVGWRANNDNKMIYREYILLNFLAAVDMIDRIAKIAEDEKHHPDLHLTQFRNLRVGMTTHEVGGLSKSDFIVASRINDLTMELKHLVR